MAYSLASFILTTLSASILFPKITINASLPLVYLTSLNHLSKLSNECLANNIKICYMLHQIRLQHIKHL